MTDLFTVARACIDSCTPDEKLALTRQTAACWREAGYTLESELPVDEIPVPGRPELPKLVAPGKVPRRRLGSPDGPAALVHAITHIEFNAINLAWDAVYRFRDMPKEFYDGWIQIADEEAYHLPCYVTDCGKWVMNMAILMRMTVFGRWHVERHMMC